MCWMWFLVFLHRSAHRFIWNDSWSAFKCVHACRFTFRRSFLICVDLPKKMRHRMLELTDASSEGCQRDFRLWAVRIRLTCHPSPTPHPHWHATPTPLPGLAVHGDGGLGPNFQFPPTPRQNHELSILKKPLPSPWGIHLLKSFFQRITKKELILQQEWVAHYWQTARLLSLLGSCSGGGMTKQSRGACGTNSFAVILQLEKRKKKSESPSCLFHEKQLSSRSFGLQACSVAAVISHWDFKMGDTLKQLDEVYSKWERRSNLSASELKQKNQGK